MSLDENFVLEDVKKIIENGNIRVLEVKLQNGLDPNMSDENGSVLLTHAIKNHQKEVTKVLIDHGADPFIKNKYGLSPYDIARRDSHTAILEMIHKAKDAFKPQKKELYQFERGASTKHIHKEYLAFPKSHDFEHQYYNDTIEIIDELIINDKKKLKSGDLGGANEHANDVLSKHFVKRIDRLIEQKKKPYYARLDFKNNQGKLESVYIGSNSIKDDRFFPPQSPYGGLFAQRKLGRIKHSSLGNIEVELIRHIENENGQILDIIDKEWGEDKGYIDPILMKQLNDKAREKMDQIWETIQAEQDTVVRQDISKPILVQGSAGSGKTIIALHRLSFLLYEYNNQLEEHKVMIMGPNEMFLKYMEQALPHLEIGQIKQTTFESFAKERLPLKANKYKFVDEILLDQPEQYEISKLKGSLEFQTFIKRFMRHNIKFFLPQRGLFLSTPFGDFKIPLSRIKDLFEQYRGRSPINQARERILQIIKNEARNFNNSLYWKNQEIEEETKKIINKKLKEVVDKFEKSWKIPNAFEIYYWLTTNKQYISQYLPINDELSEKLITINKNQMANKTVTNDDLAALLSIQQSLQGSTGVNSKENPEITTNEKFNYIIIDEVQDYSPYQLSLLKEYTVKGRIMMLGDMGQSVFSYKGIENWEDVIDSLSYQRGDYKYIELSTIYRSTIQIVKLANDIIRPFADQKYTLSDPIGRDGNEPIFRKLNSKDEQISYFKTLIHEFKDQGYKNIAFITRNQQEAISINQELKKENIETNLLINHSDEYKGGVIITPVYLSKGIEYDVVVLTDASKDKYKDNDLSRKLLYVGVTRALHRIVVCYRDEISLPILDAIEPDRAQSQRLIKGKHDKKDIELLDNNIEDTSEELEIINQIEKLINQAIGQKNEHIKHLQNRIEILEKEMEEYKRRPNLPYNSYLVQKANGEELEHFLTYVTTHQQNIKGQVLVELLDSFNDELNDYAVNLSLPFVENHLHEFQNGDLINLLNLIEQLFSTFDGSYEHVKNIWEHAINITNGLAEKIDVKNYVSKWNLQSVIQLNNKEIIFKLLRLFTEFQISSQISEIFNLLFKEWILFEPLLDVEDMIKLLWYSTIVELDDQYADLLKHPLLDEEAHVEINQYFQLYDVLNGENEKMNSYLPILQSNLFTDKELERINSLVRNGRLLVE